MAQFVGGKTFQSGCFHGSGHQLLHPPVGNALLAPPGHEHGTFFWRKTFHHIALVQVKLQRFHAGIVQIHHALFVALAEQPDLPLFQINVIQVHAHKLRQTHAAVQEQDHHAVIPLWEIALGLGAFQQIHGLFCSQVFGQDLVLFGRFDRSGRVGIQPVDLIDQIIIKAVETGQPPGSGGLFVAAFPVEEIQVFVDILFGHAGPECRVQSFGVDVLHLAVCRNKAASALHKAAEPAQVAKIAERRIGAFAGDHFQIAYIFHNIR